MTRFLGLAALFVAASAAPASAVLIDFEGIAAANTVTTESGFRDIDGVRFATTHGHIIDGAYASAGGYYSQNGTSWFMQDNTAPLTVSMANGASFSLSSFDVGEYASVGPQVLTMTLTFAGGGTAVDTFTTDGAGGFQTIATNYSNLQSIGLQNSIGRLSFDNFLINESAAVPGPGALGLLGLGIAALGMRRRKA